jgi:ribosomal protein S8
MSELNFLLEKLKILNLKYEKLNENNSDKFNIFSILLKSSDEVNLHSKFIYELLNSNGSHQKNNIFLNLFIEEINSELADSIVTEELTADREKSNIDILLKSKNQAIIIENKISTQDHSNQLSRYLNIIKKEGYEEKNISLIYLTLFNEEPNEEKVRDITINLTYETNIKNWIEQCIKEVPTIPTLRETLVQYLMLVKSLTNQSQNKGYIMEIRCIVTR